MMAAWVNIFDVGPCKLEIWVPSPDGSAMVQVTPDEYEQYGVEDLYVDENKQVVLQTKFSGFNDAWFWLHGKEIRVIPEFDAGGERVRVADVATRGRGEGQWPLGIDVFLDDGSGEHPAETVNAEPGDPEDIYEPNPLDLMELPGWKNVAVYTSGAG